MDEPFYKLKARLPVVVGLFLFLKKLENDLMTLLLQTIMPNPDPVSFFCGDAMKWTKSFTNYPANDGWSLKIFLTSVNNYDYDATPNGVEFDILITPEETGVIAPGVYKCYARVTKADESYTVSQWTMEALANPATIKNVDGRSFWRSIKDALETIITNKSIKGYEELEVGTGTSHRRVKDMGWPEILVAYGDACRHLRSEENNERLKSGRQRRRILTRAAMPI